MSRQFLGCLLFIRREVYFTIFLSLRYRIPIVVAYSIPGAILIGNALKHIPFNEAIGASIVAGIVVTILGLSGVIKKVIELIPLPVMLGMIAGVLLSFGIKAIQAVVEAPAVAGSSFCSLLPFNGDEKNSQENSRLF
ncbi:benzoate/H(+) symporter BenE family transporter [Peribacillus frigoritolerans]|nr:benzoate/H(+) symporter BenE family transporter [Peribacillus frigoritolerans]